jgi:hypothetical protein
VALQERASLGVVENSDPVELSLHRNGTLNVVSIARRITKEVLKLRPDLCGPCGWCQFAEAACCGRGFAESFGSQGCYRSGAGACRFSGEAQAEIDRAGCHRASDESEVVAEAEPDVVVGLPVGGQAEGQSVGVAVDGSFDEVVLTGLQAPCRRGEGVVCSVRRSSVSQGSGPRNDGCSQDWTWFSNEQRPVGSVRVVGWFSSLAVGTGVGGVLAVGDRVTGREGSRGRVVDPGPQVQQAGLGIRVGPREGLAGPLGPGGHIVHGPGRAETRVAVDRTVGTVRISQIGRGTEPVVGGVIGRTGPVLPLQVPSRVDLLAEHLSP